MLVVAIVGGGANLVAFLLLRGPQARSLNMRGAYLEVLGDLLGSVAVIVAAVVIALTGFTQADAIASAAIGLMFLPRTWGLLRDAVDVLLEATPKDVDLEKVRRHILRRAPGHQSSSSPRSASMPSRTRSTTMPRAATGSAHHQPKAALSASPVRVTTERYQQA